VGRLQSGRPQLRIWHAQVAKVFCRRTGSRREVGADRVVASYREGVLYQGATRMRTPAHDIRSESSVAHLFARQLTEGVTDARITRLARELR
jgi:hypothetical protein